MTTVSLRELSDSDRPVLFAFQTDPEANQMAAFTSEDPTDEEAHRAWWDRVKALEGITRRAILHDGELVGSIMTFPSEGRTEVTYWIGKTHWGKGIATEALRQLLEEVATHPVYARVATDNKGSIRVLEKCGFEIFENERGFAHARGQEIDEYVMRKE